MKLTEMAFAVIAFIKVFLKATLGKQVQMALWGQMSQVVVLEIF